MIYENLDVLKNDLVGCKACQLAKNSPPVPPLARGNQVMIVGVMPNYEDELMERPLADRAGKLFIDHLRQANFDPEKCYLTYLCKCKTKDNKDPKDEFVSACTQLWLFEEINLFRPRCIVACGKLPTRLLVKTKKSIKMEDYVGNEYAVKINGFTTLVLPVYSPTYVLNTASKIHKQIGFLRKLRFYK